jgi:hypothetical protein
MVVGGTKGLDKLYGYTVIIANPRESADVAAISRNGRTDATTTRSRLFLITAKTGQASLPTRCPMAEVGGPLRPPSSVAEPERSQPDSR